MQRIFIKREQIGEELIRVMGDDAHHLRDVLRMREGETVLACAGDEWEYTCEISEITGDAVLLRVVDAQKPGNELPSKITLLQCLPKGDKMETVVQKAVELGAARIIPVESSRCVVKLDTKKAEAKARRWNAIARAAAEQSRRMVVPVVRGVEKFSNIDPGKDACCLMPYEGETDMEKTRRILKAIKPGQPISVLIGPEGGFSDAEVKQARAAGFQTITLGRRILRTETAGMATLAILAYLLEKK